MDFKYGTNIWLIRRPVMYQRLHKRGCKHILRVNRKANNMSVIAELGILCM